MATKQQIVTQLQDLQGIAPGEARDKAARAHMRKTKDVLLAELAAARNTFETSERLTARVAKTITPDHVAALELFDELAGERMPITETEKRHDELEELVGEDIVRYLISHGLVHFPGLIGTFRPTRFARYWMAA